MKIENKLELWFPLKPWTITQGFGLNLTGAYNAIGLKGHTGIDVIAPYDTPIIPAVLAPIYRAINFGAPIRSYRAIYQIVDTALYSYEVSYGHCNQKLSGSGLDGSPIATVGNSGDVYENGVYVNPEARSTPPYRGTHLHFQVRKLVRTMDVDMKKGDKNGRIRQFIYNSDGTLFRRDGLAYEVEDYWNGFNGCVEPTPFFNGYFASDRPVVIGTLEKIIQLLTNYIK